MTILLVEDEPDDVQLIRENIEQSEPPPQVRVVENGEEAVAYLSGQGRFADRTAYPQPFLVLLDLKMPGMGGFGVLRWLREHQDLAAGLHVAILSAVRSAKDTEVAYELGAKFYWSKADCDKLQERIWLLEESWHRPTT